MHLLKFFTSLSIISISLSVHAQNFPEIGYETSNYREFTITPEEAHKHRVKQVRDSIEENVKFYYKTLKTFESADAAYKAAKKNKKLTDEKFFEIEDKFKAARKQVNYHLGNVYYLEGHLYDLENKKVRNAEIEKRVKKSFKEFEPVTPKK